MKNLILFIILTTSPCIWGQNSGSLNEINGKGEYIEYFPGTMPLVISVPHGGYFLPDDIPERPCVNCAKNQDIYTLELSREIRAAIFEQTGYYPYLIINNLHRTLLDPNRNIAEAADGNINAETAWNEFQNSIDKAISEVQNKYGKGLYVDLHGHRHDILRTELGYLSSSEELQLDDDLLNSESFIEYSSLRSLVENSKTSYSELVRGSSSLGSLLERRGYPTVPSPSQPYPKEGEPYFVGGYNTMRHGSSSGGTVDGIQVELDLELRSDFVRRTQFAVDFASVITEFLKIHYFPDLRFIP